MFSFRLQPAAFELLALADVAKCFFLSRTTTMTNPATDDDGDVEFVLEQGARLAALF